MAFQKIESKRAGSRISGTRTRRSKIGNSESLTAIRASTFRDTGRRLRHRFSFGNVICMAANFSYSDRLNLYYNREDRTVRVLASNDGSYSIERPRAGTQVRGTVPHRRGVPRQKGAVSCRLLRVEPGLIEFQLPDAA